MGNINYNRVNDDINKILKNNYVPLSIKYIFYDYLNSKKDKKIAYKEFNIKQLITNVNDAIYFMILIDIHKDILEHLDYIYKQHKSELTFNRCYFSYNNNKFYTFYNKSFDLSKKYVKLFKQNNILQLMKKYITTKCKLSQQVIIEISSKENKLYFKLLFKISDHKCKFVNKKNNYYKFIPGVRNKNKAEEEKRDYERLNKYSTLSKKKETKSINLDKTKLFSPKKSTDKHIIKRTNNFNGPYIVKNIIDSEGNNTIKLVEYYRSNLHRQETLGYSGIPKKEISIINKKNCVSKEDEKDCKLKDIEIDIDEQIAFMI